MQPRDLSALDGYVPGRGVEEVARELGRDASEFLVLSSNENPLGPSPKAAEAIRETAGGVHQYPKASHADLRAALARRWDATAEQVWLANGGDGALDYLARAVLDPGDSVLVSRPGFAYYAMSARFHHADVHGYDLSGTDDFALGPEPVLDAYGGERVVYLTSPHNPTGGRYALSDVRAVAEATGEETLVVVDEAYGEFSGKPSARRLVDARDDVAVVRTFSKAYGLAGVRLGYALVPEEWADAYAKVNTPFAASELACRAGLAALEDDEHAERTVDTVRRARRYLRNNLDARTWESHANFVLADVGDASEVAEAAKRDGVIVRDCTGFGLPDCIRVSCGTMPETREAVRVLNGVLADR